MVTHDHEERLRAGGIHIIAGVDEAGRGPLAGPVVAAAVVIPHGCHISDVDDSKKLTPGIRERLFDRIMLEAAGVGIGVVSHEEIDQVNIFQASFRAMERAVAQLIPVPQHLLVDGNRYLDRSIPFTAIIGGDARCFSIAAASIIAKVTRDRIMSALHDQYPEYGFARHKGYGTPEHLAALRKYGPSPVHRKSFRMPSFEGVTGA